MLWALTDIVAVVTIGLSAIGTLAAVFVIPGRKTRGILLALCATVLALGVLLALVAVRPDEKQSGENSLHVAQPLTTSPPHRPATPYPTTLTSTVASQAPHEPRVASGSTTASAATTSTAATSSSSLNPAPIVSQVLTRPRTIIRDGRGKSVPVLELIVSKSYPNHSVSGALRETLQRSDDLQGIISSHLTLDITIRDINGTTVDAFVLETHGAGFTETAAHNHAQERLAVTLRDRLRQGI